MIARLSSIEVRINLSGAKGEPHPLPSNGKMEILL